MRCFALFLLIAITSWAGFVGAQANDGPFEWIDAVTGKAIGPVIDKAELSPELAGKSLNVVVRFGGAASVRFDLSGPVSVGRTESEAPFTLFGDSGGTFKGERLPGGSYRLEATAFSGRNGKGKEVGKASVTFSVAGDGPRAPFDLIELHTKFPEKKVGEDSHSEVNLGDQMRQWEAVSMVVRGPETSEGDLEMNPFVDREVAVLFRHPESGKTEIVYGAYGADGNAPDSGGDSGNLWRVFFVPEIAGKWEFDVATASRPRDSEPMVSLSSSGNFEIQPADAGARGILRHEPGSRYLTWTGTGEVFLKGGTDSPENFLGYADFDGTEDTGAHGKAGKEAFLHRYEPHLRDWKPSDPTWQKGKGKGIIGALNYLAGKGVNSVYLMPFNVAGGDGKDTWPWTGPKVRDRFDVSKLEQWEIVFDHMEWLGLTIHLVLQETENDQALDGGNLGPERKLYLRELVARFAHHRGLIWNLGEENTNTTGQQKAMADYLREIDPYDHPIVVHTFPPKKEAVYRPLLGHPSIDGPSLQVGRGETHSETVKWLRESKKAGHPWFVCHDEIGPANRGVDPDSRKDGNNQKEIVREALWGNLLAGGSGAEWYFGYQNPHSDLNLEDFRSRDRLWNYTRQALEFFEGLPVAEMESRDNLTDDEDAWCFAKPGEVYVLYARAGARPKLDLRASKGSFEVTGFDPFTGKFHEGTRLVNGGDWLDLWGFSGWPDESDWVITVRKQARQDSPPKDPFGN